MQIDWITTLAQVLNFLVLVWLLQRFLYKPVLRAIDQRQQRIEDKLSEAEALRHEAEGEAEAYREKQAELESRRETLLSQARKAAEELQDRLEREARSDVDKQREAWQKTLREECDAFLADLPRQIGAFVIDLGSKALGDLADADLEKQLVARFLKQFDDLDAATLEDLKQAAIEDETGLLIETVTPLEPATKRALTRKLHERFGDTAALDYATASDLLFGIRLRVGTRTLEWSIARFMSELGSLLNTSIEEASHGQAKSRRAAA